MGTLSHLVSIENLKDLMVNKDERHNSMEDRHMTNFQCELSIVTATKLNDLIEQSKANREACEERYAADRKEAQEFRKEILERIDRLSNMLAGVVPSVETGRKIVWSIAALVAASIISGFFLGLWKIIKIAAR
jgi:hypothetical protein